MFRNSIKESGEPSLEPVSIPRRDSLSRLHDALKSAVHDGRVSCQQNFVISKYLFSLFFVVFDFIVLRVFL